MSEENAATPPPLSDLDDLQTIAGLKRSDVVLGRFKLERCLGRGGMGEVWLAHDETLDEKLALKLLPRLIHFDERAVEDLKNETRRGRQLSHPNIVRVFDFYRDSQNVAIAMEFVDGENLAVLHAREPHGIFNVDRIAPWTRQLLSGLDYAHRTGNVVHRDLKPANLLIDTGTQTLKIADFGIARCLADSMQKVTMSAQSRGTLCYMSPEQAMGRSANPLDDLYAVGATLYELLAGSPPFFTGDITSQIQKVPPPPIAERQREQGFQMPPPPAWEQIIMRCLAKERAQRPQSAAEIMEALGLGTGMAAMPYTLNTSVINPPTLPILSPPTLPVTTTTPVSTTTAAIGNTGSIAISTSATVRTVPTQTQRSFDLTRPVAPERAQAATVSHEAGKKKTPSWLLPVGIVLLLLMGGAVGGGWWLWQKFQKKANSIVRQTTPTLTTDPLVTPQPVIPTPPPKTEPASTLPVAGQDWQADQFPTLQAALDAVTQPGQKIIVGAKTFTQRIVIKKGVHLVGAGAQQTVFAVDGQGGPVIEVLDTAKDVKIEGIGFRHSGEEELSNNQPVARLRGGKVTLENCAFLQAMDAGLVATDETILILRKCKLVENKGPGLKLSGAAKATVEDCEFLRNDRGAFLELASTSAVFSRCQFEGSAVHGIEASDQAAFSARNCKISSSGQTGAYVVDPGTNGSLDDCDVTGGQQGLQAERGAGLTVAKSRIKGSVLGIATQNAGNIIVSDSTISGNSSHGIVLTAPEGPSGTAQLSGNLILENAGMGLFVEGKGLVPDVQKNKIGPNGKLDIFVRGGAGGNYATNTLMSKPDADAEGHNYFIEPGSPATWSPDNQMQPAP